MQQELKKKLEGIDKISNVLKLNNFILKVQSEGFSSDKWLEILIGAISGKPIKMWNDLDFKDFEANCVEINHSIEKYNKLFTGTSDIRIIDKSKTIFSVWDGSGDDRLLSINEDLNHSEVIDNVTIIKSELSKINVSDSKKKAILISLIRDYMPKVTHE